MKIREEILQILGSCYIEGNIVRMPELDRKIYLEVNKCLEGLGGKWSRKDKGHVFNDDPQELIDKLLLTGETIDLKKEFQFFPTPKVMARYMVDLAEIEEGDVILEPSAGIGNIADEFPKGNKKVLVELNPSNVKILESKGYEVITGDFIQVTGIHPDKARMNPPFTKMQDISHTLHAFELLKPGGILVGVLSEGPFFREHKKAAAFREWLYEHNAEIYENEPGAFKESGTMIRTRIIKVIKGYEDIDMNITEPAPIISPEVETNVIELVSKKELPAAVKIEIAYVETKTGQIMFDIDKLAG